MEGLDRMRRRWRARRPTAEAGAAGWRPWRWERHWPPCAWGCWRPACGPWR
ncbi:MAG: hypothetical protein ACLUJG_15555 [Lawsonibacter sp.]